MPLRAKRQARYSVLQTGCSRPPHANRTLLKRSCAGARRSPPGASDKAGSEVPAPPLFTPRDALLLPPALALTPLGVLAAPRRVRPWRRAPVVGVHTLLELRLSTRFETNGPNENTKRNLRFMVEHVQLAVQKFGAVAAFVRAFACRFEADRFSKAAKRAQIDTIRRAIRRTRCRACAPPRPRVRKGRPRLRKGQVQVELELELELF